MLKFIVLLFLLPLTSHAVELPRTEEEFIQRHVAERGREANIPQLEDIIRCESNFKQLAFNRITKDAGVAQINKVHWKQMENMGLDKWHYEDSVSFAVYLIKTQGLRVYNASKKCWGNKTILLTKT